MNRDTGLWLSGILTGMALGLALGAAINYYAKDSGPAFTQHIDAENNVMCYVYKQSNSMAMQCLPYNDEGDRLEPAL